MTSTFDSTTDLIFEVLNELEGYGAQKPKTNNMTGSQFHMNMSVFPSQIHVCCKIDKKVQFKINSTLILLLNLK